MMILQKSLFEWVKQLQLEKSLMENKFNPFISIWQDFSFHPGLPGPSLTLIGLIRDWSQQVKFIL